MDGGRLEQRDVAILGQHGLDVGVVAHLERGADGGGGHDVVSEEGAIVGQEDVLPLELEDCRVYRPPKMGTLRLMESSRSQ